nr:uncharacterized protein LOC104120226 [Nicotiana tomentosiformis]
MIRSSSKEVIPYELELEKHLRQLRKERDLTKEFLGQTSTQDTMENEENDGVDLAAREVAQLEVVWRIADETINDEGGQRINLNRPLVEDQFENAAPRLGRSLGDYARPVYNQGLSSVRPPSIAANNFELKQGLLQTIPNNCTSRGKVNEDPNTHLMDFEDIMNTFQYNGVSKDAIYLRAFPLLLKDDTKQWLRSLPAGSIKIWEDMNKKFLDKHLSAAKIGMFRREISRPNFYYGRDGAQHYR